MKLETIRIRFGKYKGTMIKDIPDDYLEWAISANALRGRALLYAKIRTNQRVVVENSVNADGEYIVDAYTSKHAISKCKRQYKVQGTQSYHGTSFSASKIS